VYKLKYETKKLGNEKIKIRLIKEIYQTSLINAVKQCGKQVAELVAHSAESVKLTDKTGFSFMNYVDCPNSLLELLSIAAQKMETTLEN